MESKNNTPHTNVTLKISPERRLIQPSGSYRHVDFYLRVDAAPSSLKEEHQPLTLALVLDRSGSMQGEKIQTAKQAALSVLDRLDERDYAAIVVFDDKIDVIQSVAPVTASFKTNARKALSDIQARANTALHEGWLTGCKAIASDLPPTRQSSLSRCFLLTDGIANVGITDPEQIAAQAADIREKTGIGTSTFGIGADYNEMLLGPMAVAGGGQFHNLRTANEITNTFIGELGDLLAVAAGKVRIEIEVEEQVSLDLVSAYWLNPAPVADKGIVRHLITIGDLLKDEERHTVMRFGFPRQEKQENHTVRARVLWTTNGVEQSAEWQEVQFTYAENHICDDEPRDSSVMHWVGLHEAIKAQREALELNQRHDLPGAQKKLHMAAQAINAYAGSDKELKEEVEKLKVLETQWSQAPLAAPASKEAYYKQQTASRAQKDHRSSEKK